MLTLHNLATNGSLRSSRFRSVCWKVSSLMFRLFFQVNSVFFHDKYCSIRQVFLNVLPSKRAEWIEETRKSRNHYEQLKQKACFLFFTCYIINFLCYDDLCCLVSCKSSRGEPHRRHTPQPSLARTGKSVEPLLPR